MASLAAFLVPTTAQTEEVHSFLPRVCLGGLFMAVTIDWGATDPLLVWLLKNKK